MRHYSSADAPPKHDVASAGTAAEWFTTPSMLATTPGLHRFLWSMHYPAAPALADGNAYADGVLAAPGRYTIELRVDGQSYKQSLTVVPDLRVTMSSDDYAKQFALARKAEAAQARLATAQAEATRLHAGLMAARNAPAADFAGAYAKLDANVVRISGIVDAPNPYNAWALPPHSTRTLAFLSQAFGKLAGAADDADAAPSPDALAGYDALMPMLDGALAAWEHVKSSDLAALNVQLRSAGQAELKLSGE